MKDIIKETVEAIMRHEKAYGTIAPEFVEKLLATALEEQRAETLEDFVNELLKASNVDIDQESKNHIVQIYQSILNGKDV